MTDDRPLLFVYGSLRRVFGHPMHRWLTQYARWMGEATFRGVLFSLGEYPGAVPSGRAGDRVQGEVYEVLEAEPLFARLDEYEDFLPGNFAASLYLRQLHEVELTNGQRMRAWVYVFNRPVAGLPWVPSGDWAREPKERKEGEEGKND